MEGTITQEVQGYDENGVENVSAQNVRTQGRAVQNVEYEGGNVGIKNEEMVADASSYTGNFDREMIRQKQISYVISDRLVHYMFQHIRQVTTVRAVDATL